MRKQARRLWLGDWRHDDEPTLSQSDQADTVVITPDDDGDVQPPGLRGRNLRRSIAGGIALAILCALAFALFSGSDDKQVASQQSQRPSAQVVPPTQTPQPQAQPQAPQAQVPQGAPGQGFGGPDLTGAEATKAAEAAVAKYPGDVERVTRGPTGGGYVVHVIQPDGNEVHVIVGDDFKVQGSDANSGPSNFGSGTPQ
jgi:hypothetical protein